jgi:hypothetical protein
MGLYLLVVTTRPTTMLYAVLHSAWLSLRCFLYLLTLKKDSRVWYNSVIVRGNGRCTRAENIYLLNQRALEAVERRNKVHLPYHVRIDIATWFYLIPIGVSTENDIFERR